MIDVKWSGIFCVHYCFCGIIWVWAKVMRWALIKVRILWIWFSFEKLFFLQRIVHQDRLMASTWPHCWRNPQKVCHVSLRHVKHSRKNTRMQRLLSKGRSQRTKRVASMSRNRLLSRWIITKASEPFWKHLVIRSAQSALFSITWMKWRVEKLSVTSMKIVQNRCFK